MTLYELVEDYISFRFLRPASQKSYRQRVRTITSRCGSIDVDEVSIETVRTYFKALIKDGNSQATWTSNRRHFLTLWRYAMDLGVANSNPWRSIPPGNSMRQPKPISEEHLKLAFNSIGLRPDKYRPHLFWRTMILIFSLTAIRRSQLVGLLWRDILIEDKVPHLRCRRETSKTHREYPVPLCEVGTRVLKQFRQTSKELWGDTPQFLASQVFNFELHRNGKTSDPISLTPDHVSLFFKRLSDDLGIQISPHRIRHRTATQLARLMHPKELQEFMGHTQYSTTAIYLWPPLEEQTVAVNKLVALDLEKNIFVNMPWEIKLKD